LGTRRILGSVLLQVQQADHALSGRGGHAVSLPLGAARAGGILAEKHIAFVLLALL
jgi:hypothetical protein